MARFAHVPVLGGSCSASFERIHGVGSRPWAHPHPPLGHRCKQRGAAAAQHAHGLELPAQAAGAAAATAGQWALRQPVGQWASGHCLLKQPLCSARAHPMGTTQACWPPRGPGSTSRVFTAASSSSVGCHPGLEGARVQRQDRVGGPPARKCVYAHTAAGNAVGSRHDPPLLLTGRGGAAGWCEAGSTRCCGPRPSRAPGSREMGTRPGWSGQAWAGGWREGGRAGHWCWTQARALAGHAAGRRATSLLPWRAHLLQRGGAARQRHPALAQRAQQVGGPKVALRSQAQQGRKAGWCGLRRRPRIHGSSEAGSHSVHLLVARPRTLYRMRWQLWT